MRILFLTSISFATVYLVASISTAGDYNGDGYDDLAIGVPGETINNKMSAGLVHVVFGSANGLSTSNDQLYHEDSGTRNKAEAFDFYGYAIASGDFDNDGFDDLAVGAPEWRNAKGRVNVIYGSLSGPLRTDMQFINQSKSGYSGNAEPNDQFGAALVVGDFDGDNYDDLAVGVLPQLPGAPSPPPKTFWCD